MVSLSPSGRAEIIKVLEEAAKVLPGSGLAICTLDGVILEEYRGKRDILDPNSPEVDKNTLMWFASTTKLLTSVAILQLIDRSLLSLSTPLSSYFPELSTPLRIFSHVSPTGSAVYTTSSTEITVAMMLNQSAGFGGEFREKVVAYKSTLKEGEEGKGFVNSCKKSNLLSVPPVEEPGQVYQYGNCCEWLGLLVERVTSLSLEDYMQENIFRPLGMRQTTFYPFDDRPEELRERESVMPLRWINDETGEFEALTTQRPGLTLPRKKADIEYVVGGGGIYSTCSDYILLLQHLLLLISPSPPPSPLLSRSTSHSLFLPSLLPPARVNLTAMFGEWYSAPNDGELDWSTGMCLYNKEERRGGWGRRKGSAGWMGAAGSEFWIDPGSGIAVVWSPNLMPFTTPNINKTKVALEKAIYAALKV